MLGEVEITWQSADGLYYCNKCTDEFLQGADYVRGIQLVFGFSTILTGHGCGFLMRANPFEVVQLLVNVMATAMLGRWLFGGSADRRIDDGTPETLISLFCILDRFWQGLFCSCNALTHCQRISGEVVQNHRLFKCNQISFALLWMSSRT